jgi:mTERF domain-containing protein, mitochondrial
MDLLGLVNKLSRSLPLATPHLHVTFLPLLRLSTAADQPKDPPYMAQYLISSFGFSPDRALRLASAPFLSPIKTPYRPEAVVRFLKQTGLTCPQIKSLISWCPQLLSYSVSNTLEPNLRKLVAGGFTGETLTQLIQASPSTLLLNSASSRLQFWRDNLGTDDKLLKMLRSNHRVLQSDIDEVVVPIINVFKDYGLSDVDIQRLCMSTGNKLKSPGSAKKLIEETEALGFDRKSCMFIFGFVALGKYSGNLLKRLEFFRNNYGWSDEEVRTAFKRFPNIVSQTEKTLKSKIDFLLGSVGFTNQNIISDPAILGYSLEKRLVPRHHVLNVLKIKVLNRGTGTCSVFSLSEQDFLDKFVIPYNKEVPELENIYAASCQGKLSI